MTKFKNIVSLGAMVLTIGVTSITAFAATSYNTPAEAAAGLTWKSVESVIAERKQSGKTYGTLAKEAGKLEEFKLQNLERKKNHLKAQVAAGKMTQERADAILKALEDKLKNCDGTGTGQVGREMGAKFGSTGQGRGANGANKGTGAGRGQAGDGQGMQGAGRGQGIGGRGLRDGSCHTTR